MREGEEWKNPKTQNGGHETPISVPLSSHCARGPGGAVALASLPRGVFGVRAHCPAGAGGHVLASGLSK